MAKIGIKFVDGGKVYNVETDLELNISEKVVVESVRGIEIAIVCKSDNSEITQEIKSVIRKASDDDLKKAEEFKKQEQKVVSITTDLIKKYKLDMKLVDVSFTLDGSKVIINYVCEDRVDFRELVKDLASQLKLRIELRQIGIRDQAKKLGGIGFCGKECCCKKYLNDFDKVSIKMAKTQGLSLNPTKISGICGRLMCCLAYENDFYSEVTGKMPKINSRVKTKDGIGTVIYCNLLKQTLTVKIESENDVKISEYDLESIQVVPKELGQENTQKKQIETKVSQEKVTENNQNKFKEDYHSKTENTNKNFADTNSKNLSKNNHKKFNKKKNDIKK